MTQIFLRPCHHTFAHFPHQWWREWDVLNTWDCIGLSRDIPAECAVTDDQPGPHLEES